MSRTYYHATDSRNIPSIMKDGKLNTSPEGVVYCCETPEDCSKFAAIRNFESLATTIVLKIDVPDGVEVEETFDHSESFFKCKCYGIPCDVPVDWIDTEHSLALGYKKK